MMIEYQTEGAMESFTLYSDYERKGVSLSIDDHPASPMQLVEAQLLREGETYMTDYIMDDAGDITQINLTNVS